MSFLQPLMLAALPAIALPILIHLINQRRYQTLPWGAMQFLLAAQRMSRGYTRIRQWLILACRTLALAGLIVAAARPLAGGFLGLAGGSRPDTTIVLIDRSPSMSQVNGGTLSKREAGQRQVVETLRKLGSEHWVLIESNRSTPRELNSIDELLKLPEMGPSSAAANFPRMLDAAASYLENNQTGRTEVWICSDLRANDWDARNAQWKQCRDRFAAFPGSLRFHICAFRDPAPENLAVRVTEVERVRGPDGAELAVSLQIERDATSDQPLRLPLQFEIAGARSQTEIELADRQFELRGHRIPLDSTMERGWGRVSIPADANAADNEFFFAFDQPRTRRAVLILEDAETSAALRLAAQIPPSATVECEAEVWQPHQVEAANWEEAALVLWQAPLPEGRAAELLKSLVERGGQVLFFPPHVPASTSFLDVAWGQWQEPDHPAVPTHWTLDQDLLANSLGGTSLPVGELQALRYCPPQGELTQLATLDGGMPLVARQATPNGGVYFVSTGPASTDSNLAANGVVLYVAVQRALATGAAALGKTRQITAGMGQEPVELAGAQQLAGSEDAVSADYFFHAGVYQRDERQWAVNCAEDEGQADILSDEEVHGLFEGLDVSILAGEASGGSSLVREIWRACMLGMIVALLAEAVLCVPRAAKPQDEKNSVFRQRQERQAVLREMQTTA